MTDDRRKEDRRKLSEHVDIDRRLCERRYEALGIAYVESAKFDVIEHHVDGMKHAPGVTSILQSTIAHNKLLIEENHRLRRIIDAAQLNDTKGCASFHADGRCTVSQ